jgi:hypothetical protein
MHSSLARPRKAHRLRCLSTAALCSLPSMPAWPHVACVLEKSHLMCASEHLDAAAEGEAISSASTGDHMISKPTDGPRPKRPTKPNKLVCGPEWCE